jgi:hypothetical protein
MADTKISALPASTTPLAGTEVLPIVQGGVTRQVSVANLTAGRSVASAGGTFTDNMTQGTAGKGTNFTANTPAAGMTSQLLNWYEEGTWTPTITDGTLSVNGDLSRYSRVGKKVFVNFSFYAKDISGLAGFPTQLFLGALPFSVAVGFEPGIATANITSNLSVQVAGLNGSSRAYLFSGYSGPDSVILYTAAFTNPASISLSGTFTYTTS